MTSPMSTQLTGAQGTYAGSFPTPLGLEQPYSGIQQPFPGYQQQFPGYQQFPGQFSPFQWSGHGQFPGHLQQLTGHPQHAQVTQFLPIAYQVILPQVVATAIMQIQQQLQQLTTTGMIRPNSWIG